MTELLAAKARDRAAGSPSYSAAARSAPPVPLICPTLRGGPGGARIPGPSAQQWVEGAGRGRRP
ncbi:hypothetical protein ACWGBV_09525, partial [Streptomyces sp. NPDC055051]